MTAGPLVTASESFEGLPADVVFGVAAALCLVVALLDQVVRWRESTLSDLTDQPSTRRRTTR